MIERMSAFDRKYEPDQIEAFCHAYLDRKIRPMRKVIELAKQGALLTRDGRETRPFDPNPHTFAGYVARERKRRRGSTRGSALDRPDDVLEGLRRRMIAVADQELTHWERKRTGNRDPEQLRQITRLMREISAMPKPGEGRSRAPGQRDENGQMVDGASKGIAGKMLAAHRRSQTAPEPLTAEEGKAETTNDSAHNRSNAHENRNDDNPSAPDPSTRGAASVGLEPASSHLQLAARRIAQGA